MKNRLLNVLAGMMNLAIILSFLSLLIPPLFWSSRDVVGGVIIFGIVAIIISGAVATINYISFGVFRIWNNLPAR
ncbi:hypothetical protein [Venatoribacter cucullus]|uniref:hypothetical protein n=1 Tax=Venatoribacter cucullus TaxID=2661630 RepID=UPI00223F1712|nr:hypothetical protein [Venatoribacter cucullus]UZK03401.1 hypothetical protein GAY96_05595 [Venatoribacter cucullus]